MSAVSIDMADEAYLRPEVKIEPLICRWSAWSYLLSPASLAMNLSNRFLPNLESFLASPAVHIAATKDPSMLGGPFVSLQMGDLEQVRWLVGETKKNWGPLLNFAKEYRGLDEKLQASAKGLSMDEFARTLPPMLAGTVELVYDLNNHPSMRIFEELLRHKFAEVLANQEICMHVTQDTDRPFFLSTPLLSQKGRVFAKMRFDDPRLDELAQSRLTAQSVNGLISALEIPNEDQPTFRSFFTNEAPLRNNPTYAGEGVRLRYFGHACVLLQSAKTSVLIDPWTAGNRDSTLATLTITDLPDYIDVVVLTHGHADHLVPEILLQLRGRVGVIAIPRNSPGQLSDPSLKGVLRQLGFTNVIQLDVLDAMRLPDGEIVSLPFIGEHAGLDIMAKQCLLVRLQGRAFAFMVDSDGIDPSIYRNIQGLLGPIDVGFIGLECHGAPLSWLYGPLFTRPISRRDDESRRLNASDGTKAWSIVQALGCKRAFVYAMGQEPWLRRIMGLAYSPDSEQLTESAKFRALCRDQGVDAEHLHGCREMFF